LFGSGVLIRDQEFAYLAGADGVRSASFSTYKGQAKMIATDFTHLALADSVVWIDEFLVQYGTAKPEAKTVSRGEQPAVSRSARKNLTNSIDAFLSKKPTK